MYVLIILLFIVVVNLFLFISRRFSPIPYFPTNNKDLALIVKTLKLKKGDTLYDLGAGDGTIIIEAASSSKAHVVGVEIHPLLILIMHIKRLIHPRRNYIHVKWQNIFKTNLKNATHVYLYVGPFVMKQIMSYLLKHKSKKLTKIVSYMYEFQLPPSLNKNIKVVQGYRKIYILNTDKLPKKFRLN